MCFSATVSYSTAAALIPTGLYALQHVPAGQRKYRAVAAFPLAFGIQQLMEGLVWQGLDHDNQAVVKSGALGFLFFSHFFWPAWVPLAALQLVPGTWPRRLVAVGLVIGTAMYLPIVIGINQLRVYEINGSIAYDSAITQSAPLVLYSSSLAYVLIVLIPLWLTRLPEIRVLMGLLGMSMLAAYCAYFYAFTSVWCFFAAVISVYIVRVVKRLPAASVMH